MIPAAAQLEGSHLPGAGQLDSTFSGSAQPDFLLPANYMEHAEHEVRPALHASPA